MRICLNRKVATRDNFDTNNCKLQVKELLKKKKKTQRNKWKMGRKGDKNIKRKELKTRIGIYFIKILRY